MRRLVLFGFLLFVLSGCIDYSEELWLNRDGTGRVKMVIGAQTTYENKQAINRYLEQPGISLISKSVYRKDNFTYYKLDFRFNSLEAFNSLNNQVSNADFFGRISLMKNEDGTITMKRKIALGSLSNDEDEIEQLILLQPQGDLKWSYKMHLPWKILKANATESNIDYKTKTVSWIYQTTYLWNKTQTMTVTMKPSFPILSVLLLILVLVVVLFSILWWRRHNNKMHQQAIIKTVEESPKE